MNIIDVLLAVSVLFAISRGWSIGIVRGLFGFAGLLLGGWLALQTIPIALDVFALSVGWRIIGGIGVVVALAMLGQSTGFAIGSAIRKALRWSPIRLVDSLLGSAFRLCSWAVIVWLLSSAMAYLPDRGIVHQVRTSEIVSVLDTYAPEAADRATAALRNVLRDSRFPQVFANVSPQPVNSVPAPDGTIVGDSEVRAAYRSVFKVQAQADSCEQLITGTGFVYAQDRIMTNAHVVAGSNSVRVESWDDGRSYRAEVVFFDANLDIAVLAVADLDARVLAFVGEAELGTQAVVPGFTGGGSMTPEAARISDVMIARGHDIYGQSRVDREIYVLRSQIAAGDSGAPLLDLDGGVLGVVFAAATDRSDTGYALTAQAVRAAARAGKLATAPVVSGACAA
jgi:S1-C subfamily serine protease